MDRLTEKFADVAGDVASAVWPKIAIVTGAYLSLTFLGSCVYAVIGSDIEHNIGQLSYVPNLKSGECLSVFPDRERAVTVESYQNSRFMQASAFFLPVLEMAELKRTEIGHVPAYDVAPCPVFQDTKTTVYEATVLARAAEYANSRAILEKIKPLKKTGQALHDVKFEVVPTVPAPN